MMSPTTKEKLIADLMVEYYRQNNALSTRGISKEAITSELANKLESMSTLYQVIAKEVNKL